jgi:hypothetical protein
MRYISQPTEFKSKKTALTGRRFFVRSERLTQ